MKLELLLIVVLTAAVQGADTPKSWAADNGNGTYSNPLFYDEFSDPANGNGLAVVDGELRSVVEKERVTAFRIVDQGRGRVALQTASGAYLSVAGTGRAGDVKVAKTKPGDAETFQWVDLQRGDTLLLSLATHRYIVAPPAPRQ
jgi:hypothetical protein